MTDEDEKRVGRPSAINPARLCAILNAVKDGNYFTHAASAAGVSSVTASTWAARGRTQLAVLREANAEVDAEIADWLLVWPDNYTDSNGMWDAPNPVQIPRDLWLYTLFSVLLEKARAQAVTTSIKEIRDAGAKNWQAHAWYLERTHPELFGRQQKIEHTGADGGPIQTQTVTTDELLQRIRDLKEAKEATNGE